MNRAKIAAILLTSAVTATIVATCLLGLGALGDVPKNAANALRARLPQTVVHHLLTDDALDSMTVLVMTTPAAGAAACVANSVRVGEQCSRRCDARIHERFEYNSGVCGFATRCECDGITATPTALADPVAR